MKIHTPVKKLTTQVCKRNRPLSLFAYYFLKDVWLCKEMDSRNKVSFRQGVCCYLPTYVDIETCCIIIEGIIIEEKFEI
jgi:hypothetical protein